MTQAVLYNHTATLLEDGRVLVTGGQTAGSGTWPPPRPPPTGVVSAEIYDPSTGRWSPTAPMTEPRRWHGAVLLEDGGVLVSGGLTDEYETSASNAEVTWEGSFASSEVYDPSTETWSLAGDMPDETVLLTARQINRPAILLDMLENGMVMAVGGLGPSAAIYDASSGAWTPAGEATSGEYRTRQEHTSVLLGDGKVLYIGGWDRGPSDSINLFDTLTGSSSPTGSMNKGRWLPTAAALGDRRVLVTGGGNNGNLASAEIYDPSSGTWSSAGEMAKGRMNHTMTLLSDGRVLVTGGGSKTPEIYDPSTDTWSEAANNLESRAEHTATVLSDGRVLVVGGVSGSRRQPFPKNSAEVYDPLADTWTPSTEAAP